MTHSASSKSAGFFRRAVDGFVAARERQAMSAVAPYLLSLDDKDLSALGHDRKALEGLARHPSPLL
jgi:hypothetical protein